MSYVDWHREMLADQRRVRAFGGAVRRAVRPGDVVADIGTGTGLLALVAASAGASKVYAIDSGPVIEVARQIALDNSLGERITFVRGEAREVELPESVDLLMGEIIGSFGIEENICEVFAECRQRFLKPGGRVLPDALELFVAPCSKGAEMANWHATLNRDLGLDLRALEALTQHTPTTVRAQPHDLLAPGALVLSIELDRDSEGPPEGEVQFIARRPGRFCGLAGWFRALHGGEPIHSTEPPSRGSSWAHSFMPIGEPMDLSAGQRLRVKLMFDDPFVGWEVHVEGHEARAFHQFRSVPADDFRAPGERTDGNDSTTG